MTKSDRYYQVLRGVLTAPDLNEGIVEGLAGGDIDDTDIQDELNTAVDPLRSTNHRKLIGQERTVESQSNPLERAHC